MWMLTRSSGIYSNSTVCMFIYCYVGIIQPFHNLTLDLASISATYDTLPWPRNLHQWLSTEHHGWMVEPSMPPSSTFCQDVTLHWLRVVSKLAEVVEGRRLEASRGSPARCQQRTSFLRYGEPATTTSRTRGIVIYSLKDGEYLLTLYIIHPFSTA